MEVRKSVHIVSCSATVFIDTLCKINQLWSQQDALVLLDDSSAALLMLDSAQLHPELLQLLSQAQLVSHPQAHITLSQQWSSQVKAIIDHQQLARLISSATQTITWT